MSCRCTRRSFARRSTKNSRPGTAQLENERRKFRYEARVEMYFRELRTNRTRADQEQKLVKLVLDDAAKKKKYGDNEYYNDVNQFVRSRTTN